MDLVLTLIGDPAASGLPDAWVAEAAAVLAGAGAEVGRPDWLAEGEACDLAFSGLTEARARACLEERLRGWPVDVAVLPAAGRRKALLVADMESTIIGQEMIDELADAAGLRAEVSTITEKAMAGALDFEAALRERVGMLAGLPTDALDRAAERMTLTPGARTLVRTLRRHGAYTVLVSGGFACFTARVREACGFDEDRANRLLVGGGRLTGRVAEPVLGPSAKLAALREIAAARGLSIARTCAVGDGANDAEMLARAGLGAAYHGKPPARAAARLCIDHGDLTAILFAQGYRRAEFAE